jgi:hypothetical protein
LAGRLGRDVEEGLRIEPELLASTNVSQVAIIDAPSSMLLLILAAWPAPGPPAWITALAHLDEKRRARSNASRLAPDHEGKSALLGRGDAAGDGGVHHR